MACKSWLSDVCRPAPPASPRPPSPKPPSPRPPSPRPPSPRPPSPRPPSPRPPSPSPPPPPPSCTPYQGACFPARRRSLLAPALYCCAGLGCAIQLPCGDSSICATAPGAPSILSVDTTGGAFGVTCVPPINTGGNNVGECGARWIRVACVAVCRPLILDLGACCAPYTAAITQWIVTAVPVASGANATATSYWASGDPNQAGLMAV